MGVQGLWQLIEPVARPIKLEHLHGQRLAIDSSIWLYHFRMAMRDKEGRTLKNAHILGFFWRIIKLLFYGIRPVFVFDGGAPIIKRKTLTDRRARREGARETHTLIAKKLLNATIRQAALQTAVAAQQQTTRNGKAKAVEGDEGDDGETGLGDNTVYFDDAQEDDPSRRDMLRPAGAASHPPPRRRPSPSPTKDSSSPQPNKKVRRNDWHRDQYALPPMEADLATITANNGLRSQQGGAGRKKRTRTDMRFSTEEELRALMATITPSDLDTKSEIFVNLPSELQYELLADLRLQSRGTSYNRLQSMLAGAPTPIDFSRAQIKGLKTRNDLTMRVLESIDEIGSANIQVNVPPTRVAGARNREYVLTRNDGPEGGFRLSLVNEGTSAEKAVEVHDSESDDDDDADENAHEDQEEMHLDLEPVDVGSTNDDPLLTEAQKSQQAQQLREAREAANDPVKRAALRKRLLRQDTAGGGNGDEPLFAPDSDPEIIVDDDDEWDEVGADEMEDLQRALDASRKEVEGGGGLGESNDRPESQMGYTLEEYEAALAAPSSPSVDDADMEDVSVEAPPPEPRSRRTGPALGFRMLDKAGEPERLDTSAWEKEKRRKREEEWAKIREAEEKQRTVAPQEDADDSGLDDVDVHAAPRADSSELEYVDGPASPSDDVGAGPLVSPPPPKADAPSATLSGDMEPVKAWAASQHVDPPTAPPPPPPPAPLTPSPAVAHTANPFSAPASVPRSATTVRRPRPRPPRADSKEPTQQLRSEPVFVPPAAVPATSRVGGAKVRQEVRSDVATDDEQPARQPEPIVPALQIEEAAEESPGRARRERSVRESTRELTPASDAAEMSRVEDADADLTAQELTQLHVDELPAAPAADDGSDDAASQISWSESEDGGTPPPNLLGPDGFPLPTAEELEEMDAEAERELEEMRADKGDFASFLSSTKKMGLQEARDEIEREVTNLRAEHARTKRSEEDITVQMAQEIQQMLRLFGVPYITAPMEAEAQCAELVSRSLVDGIITDDSDVFLFGGTNVYRNMFNQNKVVERFTLGDLQRNLGIDRAKLVSLAYLLGSDYTAGLPGVGPVTAMEILALFGGQDGLVGFRDWWHKVQSGRDSKDDTRGKTMRRIKKTLAAKVHLGDEWPDPRVLDAYYSPRVDESEEPFTWGTPDLDQIRAYLGSYLGWPTSKTDEHVVPVIERMLQKKKQGTLDRAGFMDLSGPGSIAPRIKPKYGSSRLQDVVDVFRINQKVAKGSVNPKVKAKVKAKGPAKRGSAAKAKVKAKGKAAQAPAQAPADEDSLSDAPTGSGADTDARIDVSSGSDEDDSDSDSEGFELLDVPEAQIGKAMGATRPVLRRDAASAAAAGGTRAQRELDAAIERLEGAAGAKKARGGGARSEKRKHTLGKAAPAPADAGAGAGAAKDAIPAPTKSGKGRKRARAQLFSDDSSEPSTDDEDDDEAASPAVGPSLARGTFSRPRKDAAAAAAAAPTEGSASASPMPEASTARKAPRGAAGRPRGKGSRNNPHLRVARNMNLDDV